MERCGRLWHRGDMEQIATARPARLSPKLRAAIELRVRKGLTITDACAQAGLSTAGWHKAMHRAEVRLHMKAVQDRFIAEAEVRRAALRVEAMEVAAKLLTEAKSETTKVRLIELLLADGKGPQVAVNVDARQITAADRGVYTYQRPANLAPQHLPITHKGED